MHTFVIAEAAATHDGDFGKAIELVDLAAEIGANAVKFQFCSNPAKLAERRHAPEYLESYRLLNHPMWWHDELSARAFVNHIEYMTTVYLAEDIPAIAPFVQRFKVASFESEDKGFVLAHGGYAKEVILSLGMNSAGRGWLPRMKFLHCVSAYPTPVEEANLGVLRLPEHLRELDGFSDHTKHPLTGAFAVCAGAQIIEFHIRLGDTSPTNADYEVARTREEARVYIANIRLAEVMMGDGVKRIMPSEEKMLKYRVKG